MTSSNPSNDPSSSSLTFEFDNFTETSISDNTSNSIMTPFDSSNDSPSTSISDFPEIPLLENTSNSLDNFVMMIDMIQNLADHGRMSEAIQWFETAMSTARDTLGIEHSMTLDIMNHLGRIYGDEGRLDDAVKLLQETLENRHRLLGSDDVKTLETAINLAWTYEEQGDVIQKKAFCLEQQRLYMEARIARDSMCLLLGEAERLREYIYSAKERILGSDHFATIESRKNLAWVYGKQGYMDKAIDIFMIIFPKAEEDLGERHKTTLSIIQHLANIYLADEQLMEAELYYKKLLERIESFGENDTRVIITQRNIAYIYGLQGRIDEAIEILEELVMRRLNMNEEDPELLGSINNLASLYFDKGDMMRALSLHENLYITRIRMLGEDDSDTIRSRLWVHHIRQRLGMN